MGRPAVDEISTLREGLEARGDEVADYSFRLFSDARTDFVHKVSDDYDARCSQVKILCVFGLSSTELRLCVVFIFRWPCWRRRHGSIRIRR